MALRCRYSRIEIERILGQPFSSLTRQEMAVKKLLSKFHDNPEMVRRAMGTETHGFDPHLAERTRIKNERGMSEEEQEWVSVDTVLHPEVSSCCSNYKSYGMRMTLLGLFR